MKVLIVGREEALARFIALKKEAQGAGVEVEFAPINPELLPRSLFGRFFAKKRLRRMTDIVGDDGLVVVAEADGDRGWEPWMVLALGAPFKKIAAPARMKGVGNIGETDSGTVTYEDISTVAALNEIDHAALWAAQKCAYRVSFCF